MDNKFPSFCTFNPTDQKELHLFLLSLCSSTILRAPLLPLPPHYLRTSPSAEAEVLSFWQSQCQIRCENCHPFFSKLQPKETHPMELPSAGLALKAVNLFSSQNSVSEKDRPKAGVQ